jgi:hypothetical protein
MLKQIGIGLVVVTMACKTSSLFGYLPITPAAAHDSWINGEGWKNDKNELCCGANDCFTTSARAVYRPGSGYVLPTGEFVPEMETLPSADGLFWRCQKPDGSRRCFFAPARAN